MLRHTLRCLESRIHKINKAAQARELRKFGREGGPRKGIPQKLRADMGQVSIIHETPRVLIAGRNRCNNFQGNQYAVIAKKTGNAVLIDMADDWADDWHIFLEASKANAQLIFFTHLHMDCMLGLHAFLHMSPRTKVAFAYPERYWAMKWRDSCLRYGRYDLSEVWLPFHSDLNDPEPRRHMERHMANATGLPAIGSVGNVVLTSGDASRLSPSLLPAPDVEMLHVPTPGHSLGHQCLWLPREKLLFTGDLIFKDSVGRVDLPNANGTMMAQSLRSLETFPDDTILLPGHGAITTMARERKHNRALQRVYELMAAGDRNPCVGANAGFF